MNKVDLIEEIASKLNLTKRETTLIVDSLFETMEDRLLKGEEIKISGFGNINVTKKKARKGIDPNTQQEIVIPSTKTLTIKTSKILKAKLNKNK